MREDKGSWIRYAPLWVAVCIVACAPTGVWADLVNAAPMGATTQSTTLSSYGAHLAVDGNLGNFTHTQSSDTNPAWWQDDLGMVLSIQKIILYNRTSCCGERLRDVTVSVLDDEGTVVYTSELLNPGNILNKPASIEIDLTAAPVVGQTVRVVRTPDPGGTSNDDARVLALGEVQVMVEESDLPVMIGTQPAGATKYVGGCHVMSVGLLFAQNATSISYQWFKDDGEIQDATGPRLILGDLQEDDGGVYRVEVTADEDTLVSSSATLVVKGLNLALTGTATQSSLASGGVPERAIDGNTSGLWSSATITHTADAPGQWWQVKLFGESIVEKVVLWNRMDSCCSNRLTNFRVSAITTEVVEEVEQEVEVWGEDFFTDLSFPNTTTAGFEVPLPADTSCQIIRVQRLGPDAGGLNILSLAEVEVFGSGPLPPPPDLPNLCRECGVLASQSTTNGAYTAALAIDGNFGNFTHTVNSDQDPSWQVDLGAMSEIAIIRVYNRTSCCGLRLRDITVSVLDDAGETVWESELLNPENELGSPAVLVQDLRIVAGGAVMGQIVRVHRTPDPDFSGGGSSPDDAYVLSIGEVEVFASPSWCEEEGDTHCGGLTVEGPTSSLPGVYTATASGTDDSGDEILYTFVADNGVDTPMVIGPQASEVAVLELLTGGDWTISVTVDDDELCLDEADDATCSEVVTVVVPGENLALGGTATQSSEYPTSFPASLAIDDNLTNFTHTSETDAASAWEVDLGEEGTVYAILVHNRDNCCGSRLRDITVSILDSSGELVWESELLNPENVMGAFPLGPAVLTIDVAGEAGGPVKGNIVRVTRLRDDDLSGGGDGTNAGEYGVLSLAEVQVYGIVCPSEGDTHCTGLTVEATGESSGDTFEHLATATASDDSGDAITYTFVADNGTDTITVGPQAENTALLDLTVGSWTVTVTLDDDSVCDDSAEDATCTQTVEVAEPGVGPFVRGDANGDGSIDLSDGVFIFNYLFLGGAEPGCLASADTNGEGTVTITSGVYVLNFLFLGGPEPVAPYPTCGLSAEASDATLGCATPHSACNP